VTTFAGVRVQSGNEYVRRSDSEVLCQFSVQAVQYRFDSRPRNGAGDGGQWQVGGSQCNPQSGRSQHHDYLPSAGFVCQVFGVPGKGDTGIVDYALVYRCRNQGLELLVSASLYGAIKRLQDVACVGRIQLTCLYRFPNRAVCNGYSSGYRCALLLPAFDLKIYPQLECTFNQYTSVTNQNEFGR
jgi:hypothetical protein